MWEALFDDLGRAAELIIEQKEQKEVAKREAEREAERYVQMMQDYALNCRRCRKMAYPIAGTSNRYRCPCGNQFAGSRHPL